VAAFEGALGTIPEVLQAQRLFGDPDYLLRIIAVDLAGFQRLYDDRLSTLPGLRRLTSTIVMKNIVDPRPLPQEPSVADRRFQRLESSRTNRHRGRERAGVEEELVLGKQIAVEEQRQTEQAS
jgi:DNA-binding Lrp family transcriptional regulator